MLKKAGKILKAEGPEAAETFLQGKGSTQSLPDFKPPAKCLILAKSRPFEEWPISIASRKIQEKVYGMTREEFDDLCDPVPKSKNAHTVWLKRLGLQNLTYRNVQGLNKIIGQAINRYEGVIKKVENRNEKRRSRVAKHNESRKETGLPPEPCEPDEDAFGEDGHLLQPPGTNPSIYGYQGVSPFACISVADLPIEYHGYTRSPDDELRTFERVNRLDIPRGQPGYVPEYHRTQLNPSKNRRYRLWYSNANNRHSRNSREGREEARIAGALLVQLRIEDDWVLLDARGLLRNVRWRKLAPQDLTLNKLLKLFSGDPVIDTRRGLVTFSYKEAVVLVHSEKPVTTAKSVRTLTRVTQNGPVALVSVDLGQNRFMAAKISTVTQLEGKLFQHDVHRFFLDQPILTEYHKLRTDADRLEDSLRVQAISSLPSDLREEVLRVDSDTPECARQRLCTLLGITLTDIPWDNMLSHTTFLAEAALRVGKADLGEFDTEQHGKKVRLRRRDRDMLQRVRFRLSESTRTALNEALWDLKRSSDEYARLSLRKTELARRSVNWVVSEATQRTSLPVVVNVEDLNVRIFTGNGKREPGWANFFTRKKENRWFIQALHKAFCDLGPHRGVPVIEVSPQRTSITCTQCGHCNRDNRDGEHFLCLQCGYAAHADLDVATDNIEKVALVGKAMPKSEVCERFGDVQVTGTSRKKNTLKNEGSAKESDLIIRCK